MPSETVVVLWTGQQHEIWDLAPLCLQKRFFRFSYVEPKLQDLESFLLPAMRFCFPNSFHLSFTLNLCTSYYHNDPVSNLLILWRFCVGCQVHEPRLMHVAPASGFSKWIWSQDLSARNIVAKVKPCRIHGSKMTMSLRKHIRSQNTNTRNFCSGICY